MKHTPGPWKAVTVHGVNGNLVYCRILSDNYQHPGGMAYTTIPLKNKTKKQQELAGLYASQGEQLAQWNAKLIAAAPELLASLEDTYRDLLSELPMSLRCSVKWQANLSHMRHVLAKANGMNEQDYEYSITQGRVNPQSSII